MSRALPILLATALLAACIHTPVHPEAIRVNNLCVQELHAGHLEDAETYCELGREYAPQWADLWTNLGLIAMRRGDTEAAKQRFINAIHEDPDQAQAHNDLGDIYLAERDFRAAVQAYERALKVNPEYAEARNNLALAYFQMGDFTSARRQYRTLVAFAPTLATAHHDLGVVALKLGHGDEAIRELTRATELDPHVATAWLDLGGALDQAGRFADARDAFGSCLDADASEERCRTNYAAEVEKLAILPVGVADSGGK